MVALPTVTNVLIDRENKITYKVLAYRELSREERLMAVRYFLAIKKGKKKIKPGTTITIVSTLH